MELLDAGGLAPHWWWLGAGLAMVLLELLTGSMFLLWPGLAALIFAGVALAAPGLPVAAQLAAFAALATLLTVLGRALTGPRPGGGTDRPHLNERSRQLVGRPVRAAGAFAQGEGAVELDDGRWSARMVAGAADAADGAPLVVAAVEGATLIVRPA